MKTTTKIDSVLTYPEAPPIVKLGVAVPFQIVGGDVFTYVDVIKHRVVMTETERGVLVEIRSKLNGPSAPAAKVALVPWSNITYVLYGQV